MGLNHDVIHSAQRNGVPVAFPSLADNLRNQGYYSYFIGKWHLGNFKNDYLPTSRGFDEFLGWNAVIAAYGQHYVCVTFRILQPMLRLCCGYEIAITLKKQTNRAKQKHILSVLSLKCYLSNPKLMSVWQALCTEQVTTVHIEVAKNSTILAE